MIYTFGSPHAWRKARIYTLKVSADMCKQDLCRFLALQIFKELFGEVLLRSPTL